MWKVDPGAADSETGAADFGPSVAGWVAHQRYADAAVAQAPRTHAGGFPRPEGEPRSQHAHTRYRRRAVAKLCDRSRNQGGGCTGVRTPCEGRLATLSDDAISARIFGGAVPAHRDSEGFGIQPGPHRMR